MDPEKIAKKLEKTAFYVGKEEMDGESLDRWLMFSVWFYFRRQFFVNLDQKTGKHYFYTSEAESTVKEKLPKGASIDRYDTTSHIGDLMEYVESFEDVRAAIKNDHVFLSDDKRIIEALQYEEIRQVLYWVVDDSGDWLGGWCDGNLLMLTDDICQEKLSLCWQRWQGEI